MTSTPRALEAEDEEMDRLRRSMFRILLDEEWNYGVEPAIDLALLGRYYERIADHAVSMARRVVYLVTGYHPVPLDGPLAGRLEVVSDPGS